MKKIPGKPVTVRVIKGDDEKQMRSLAKAFQTALWVAGVSKTTVRVGFPDKLMLRVPRSDVPLSRARLAQYR